VWQQFWDQHTSLILPPPPLPSVDFDESVVIAVIAGWRPNVCYGLMISGVYDLESACVVRMVERLPCPDEECLQTITNPYHIIVVDKADLPVEMPVAFDHKLPG
jgi:hypothetical protein